MNREEILNLIKNISKDKELKDKLLELLVQIFNLRENQFHPLVFINGTPKIGKNVYIGLFSEVNAKNTSVIIGDNCDISSFVSINAADSHKKCIGLLDEVERSEIILEDNVFIGSHSFIGGKVHIGHNSVVAAGTILIDGGDIPPYSLIVGNPAEIKKEYYKKIS